MEGKSASAAIPYLRSCKRESEKPINGEVTGDIPKWLKGCLVRIGSGLIEFGQDRYNHVFDGMALMHRFGFQDGKVTYRNRFLNSDAYKRNKKANRIVVSEFATRGCPDPCKTIFQRFSSLFSMDEMTDNDLVNIVLYGDEAYACSETNYIWKIDPDTLESIERVNLPEYLPINAAIAHAHEDTDGTVYNVGSSLGYHCSYSILKFPAKENKSENTFQKASVVCKIDGSRALSGSYHHSFAMTENYFVFVEQPLYLYLPRLMWAHFVSGAYAESLYWDGERQTRFHVIRKSDGKLLDTRYLSKAFFVFHHINAYEEDGQLVVDMCCYDEGSVVKKLYVEALEQFFNNPQKQLTPSTSRARRYVLPLDAVEQKAEDNLVTLQNTKATACKQRDGSVFCTPQVLTGTDPWSPELPRINYEKFNGKKYKYFYALANNGQIKGTHLIKVDVETKSTVSWSEKGVIPSEPVFISEPDADPKIEDSGILLASLLYTDDESKVSLLVLNAKTMQEIGRATFYTESSVPADFHGTFFKKA